MYRVRLSLLVIILFYVTTGLQGAGHEEREVGLADFDLHLNEIWGFADRAKTEFVAKFADQEDIFTDFTKDVQAKVALENFGMYAFGKAKLGEECDKSFIDEFEYRLPECGRIVLNAVGDSAESTKMVRSYLAVCYVLGSANSEY